MILKVRKNDVIKGNVLKLGRTQLMVGKEEIHYMGYKLHSLNGTLIDISYLECQKEEMLSIYEKNNYFIYLYICLFMVFALGRVL